jgi:hypothetical protein
MEINIKDIIDLAELSALEKLELARDLVSEVALSCEDETCEDIKWRLTNHIEAIV